MNFTTKEILKLIPLDNTLREQILKEYDSYGDGKKYDMGTIIWDAFTQLTNALIDLKFKKYMFEVENKQRKLTTDLYIKAKEAVYQDYDDILSGKKQDREQMEAIQKKLQSLAKLTNKTQTPVQSS